MASIVFLGHSHGKHFASYLHSPAARLKGDLANFGIGADILNFCEGGRRVLECFTELPRIDRLPSPPDVVVIIIGDNDMGFPSQGHAAETRTSETTVAHQIINLARTVLMSTSRKTQVIILGLLPRPEDVPAGSQRDGTRRFHHKDYNNWAAGVNSALFRFIHGTSQAHIQGPYQGRIQFLSHKEPLQLREGQLPIDAFKTGGILFRKKNIHLSNEGQHQLYALLCPAIQQAVMKARTILH